MTMHWKSLSSFDEKAKLDRIYRIYMMLIGYKKEKR